MSFVLFWVSYATVDSVYNGAMSGHNRILRNTMIRLQAHDSNNCILYRVAQKRTMKFIRKKTLAKTVVCALADPRGWGGHRGHVPPPPKAIMFPLPQDVQNMKMLLASGG